VSGNLKSDLNNDQDKRQSTFAAPSLKLWSVGDKAMVDEESKNTKGDQVTTRKSNKSLQKSKN
jgi:hypothetical protein